MRVTIEKRLFQIAAPTALDTARPVSRKRGARAFRTLTRAAGGAVAAIVMAAAVGATYETIAKKVIAGYVPARPEDLHYIAKLASQGELKPVVDRIYRLEDAAEAHAYVDTGRKRGSVVLTVANGPRQTTAGALAAARPLPAQAAAVS